MLGTAAKTLLVEDTDTLKQVAKRYAARTHLPVFLDTETTGLNSRQNKLVTVQLMQPGYAPVVVDWRRSWPSWGEALDEALRDLLVVGHNLKFDWQFLYANGITLTRCYCTQVAEQLLLGMGREDARVSGFGLHLTDLATRYGASEQMSKQERNWFIDLDTRVEQRVVLTDEQTGVEVVQEVYPWHEPLPPEQLDYAAQDIRVLETIYTAQWEQFEHRSHLQPVLDIEMRCLPALALMESTGICVDEGRWREFIATKAVEARAHEDTVLEDLGLAIVEQRIEEYDLARDAYEAYKAAEAAQLASLRDYFDNYQGDLPPWGEFKKAHMDIWYAANAKVERPKLDTEPPNLDSPKQLLTALEALGVPATATDSDQLKQLEDDYPVVGKLLAYRKSRKFVTSFGDAILERIEAEDGRIHPEYQQIGASTGRMSCTKPNWQQVPSRGDGKELRKCVVAAPGKKLLTADFSNIELRILAEYSQDANLLRMFAEEVDLHSEVARMMFGLAPDTDPKHTQCPSTPGWTYRDVAKVINYMLVYGGGAPKLARTLRVSRDYAAALMASYFKLFPGVVAWLEQTKKAGVERLTSYTMAGRVRTYTLPQLPPRPSFEERKAFACVRARIERQAMNTPIQGTSADITKLALALVYEDLDPKRARAVAVVHDEIVVESREDYVPTAVDTLGLAMNEAAHRFLKTVALPWPEVSVADRWEKA